jgi:opacity protein-like surface antigen
MGQSAWGAFALAAIALFAGIDGAHSAYWPSEPPALRGTLAPGFARWDGWQAGIQGGYSNMKLSSSQFTNGPSFGGFVGYNFQWDQLVIGFDVGYKYASVLGFDDGVTQQFKLVDFVPIRARAGYAIGTFLPYALLGGAIGRFNYFNPSTGIGEDNAFSAGFLTGLGVDWLITPGVFIRAEWQYIAFASVGSTLSQVNTGQLAIGVKF